MNITEAMEELRNLTKELGINEYFDGLDFNEILIVALFHYGNYLKSNVDEIKKDMEYV